MFDMVTSDIRARQGDVCSCWVVGWGMKRGKSIR